MRSVSKAAQCFFTRDLVLCGEIFCWKCVIWSFALVVGGHAILAISGSRIWYLAKYLDVGFW